MMREKSRARRRVRTRVALFLSLASLAGLYLIRLLGAALHAAGLSAVALSTAGTLLCFLLPALAGLFLLDGDQRGLIALRALSAQHVLCLAAALLFAAAHGVDAAFLPRFLLGCLLGGMARRTGSILAPMLMHGCYNAAVLLLGFAGASFSGRSLLFCALGLLSAVLCFAMVARVYLARANRAPVAWGGALSRKETAKLAAAVLAVIAAVVVTEVTKP